jgi:cysteine synthase
MQGSGKQDVKQGVLGCIGNTPLMRIQSLSDATGCEILAKAEFLNPGGSVKDRIALHMVQKAAESGRLSPGALITEATAGSTGISLAMVAAACGYKCALI